MQAKRALSGYSCWYIPVPFSVYVYAYVHSYLVSFLHPHCVQLAILYCHALLGYWYNEKSIFLEERCRLFSSQIMKHSTLTKNSELIILVDKIFSYLPPNWLDKLKEVNGDSIANKESILYCNTKSILHTWPNSRAWDILHASSFSDNLPDAGTNIVGACSNIECMMQSLPNNIQPATHMRVSSGFWAVLYVYVLVFCKIL